MRQLVWIGGPKPSGMTNEKYKSVALQLATIVSGELVSFGDTNFAIVGDSRSAELMKKTEQNADSPKQTAG